MKKIITTIAFIIVSSVSFAQDFQGMAELGREDGGLRLALAELVAETGTAHGRLARGGVKRAGGWGWSRVRGSPSLP